MTPCHLISYADLTLLRDVNTNGLGYSGCKFIGVFSREDHRIDDRSISAVGHFQRSIANFSCLLSKDGAKESLLRSKLRLSFRRNSADQDISGSYFRTDTDDSSLIKILQCIISDARHIGSNLFRSKLRISGFQFILFNMDGSVNVILHQSLGKENRILVVISFPSHKADKRILSECNLSILRRGAVRNDITRLHMIMGIHNRLLIVTVTGVASNKLHQLILIVSAVFVSLYNNLCGRRQGNLTTVLRHHAGAGVHRRLIGHTGIHYCGFRGQKRNGLTLHVRSHERTVRIVVL